MANAFYHRRGKSLGSPSPHFGGRGASVVLAAGPEQPAKSIEKRGGGEGLFLGFHDDYSQAHSLFLALY